MGSLEPQLVTGALDPRVSAEVLALAVRAANADEVRALSEQTVFDVRRLEGSPAPEQATHHLLLTDPANTPPTAVLGYAHLEQHDDGAASAEVVVDPDHRRLGHGTTLVRRLLQDWPAVRVWAHGDLPAARALADHVGLRSVRDLLQMKRPLTGEYCDLPDVPLPEGFSVRPFEVGRDEHAWLAVNARAFATHPEQGRMGLADLTERIKEPWFDPSGFLLVHDDTQTPPQLAAFHWTKVEPAGPGHPTPTIGEVYVLAVDPAYQGRGLGKPTTMLGLRHLRACGLAVVELYVDGDNDAAIATYHRLGFERSAIDVMYAAPR